MVAVVIRVKRQAEVQLILLASTHVTRRDRDVGATWAARGRPQRQVRRPRTGAALARDLGASDV